MREGKSSHEPVARDLGDDRGGGDGGDDGIAADDGLAVAADVDPIPAVDENQSGPHRQRLDGAGERPQRGAQNVVTIDARRRCDRDGDLGAGADFRVKTLPRRRIKLLGIIEAARDALGIEDDGRSHHRSGEWPPSRLIAAGDRPYAALQRRPLAAKTRAERSLPQRQAGRSRAAPSDWRGWCRGRAQSQQRPALEVLRDSYELNRVLNVHHRQVFYLPLHLEDIHGGT